MALRLPHDISKKTNDQASKGAARLFPQDLEHISSWPSLSVRDMRVKGEFVSAGSMFQSAG